MLELAKAWGLLEGNECIFLMRGHTFGGGAGLECYGLNICVPTNSSAEALMGRDLYIGPLEIIRSQGLELLRWGQCLYKKEMVRALPAW